MTAPVLSTERLLIRRWQESDRAPYAALNADPQVREFFAAGVLTREQSDHQIERIESELARDGFGFWALELRASGEFIGFTGLSVASYGAHFDGAMEVGWRLARPAWGHGYASEAAREALRFGFVELAAAEIVALTARSNTRSRAVMERIGMKRDAADDFDDRELTAGHPLRRCVLYRIRAAG